MIRVMQPTDGELTNIDDIAPRSWVHVVNPTDDELSKLNAIGIPMEYLGHGSDPNERSRVVKRGDVTLLVVHFPFEQEKSSKVPYITLPLSIFLVPEYLVTIEPLQMGIFQRLSNISPAGISASDSARFVMNLVLLAASEYLSCLQTINVAVEDVEDQLQRSLRNREVLQLLNYQKSLVYFATALNSIETLLEKLLRGDFLEWAQEDRQLAEDALIEIRQASYQVEIAENILTQMMDAFASIVSNNLNTVMKFLAAITIVISVPMLIASLYGMNVPLPGGGVSGTFGFVIALSMILAFLVIVVFWKMDWL